MNRIASPLIRLSAPLILWDSMARRRAAAMSSSIQSDGWLRVSLVFMARRRAVRVSLPLLSSSKRVSARDGVGDGGGGGSGPNRLGGEGEEVDVEDVGEDWCSGVLGGLGK